MDSYLIAVFLGYFLSLACFSLVLNGVLLRFSKTLGVRNSPEGLIRWSQEVKPSVGGIGFYCLFLLSVASYAVLFPQNSLLMNWQLLGLLGASSLAFLMGLADDAYNTRPFLKLCAQVACGLILITSGLHITIFNDNLINYILTILWVVGIMNSINMLDNMDAITTVISMNTLIYAILFEVLRGDYGNAYFLIMIGVLAALAGFLYYNWNPSKLFMGDTGSQFLGMFLAAIGIICFWNAPDFEKQHIQSKQIIVTILAFVVPVIDTSVVVINRIAAGRSPFIGGKDHTTHHLVYMGFSERKVALILAGISFFSLGLTFFINKYIVNWTYTILALFSVYILGLFTILFRISQKHKAYK